MTLQVNELPLIPMDDEEFWVDPYPILHRIRADHRVGRTPDGLVAVLHWDDAFEAVRGTQFVQDGIELLESMGFEPGEPLHTWAKYRLNTLEGADHRRVRSLASWALSKRRMDDLRPIIVKHAHALLDEQLATGELDPLDFAYRLPRVTMMEFLGVSGDELDGAVNSRGTSGIIDAFGKPMAAEQRAVVNAHIQRSMDHTAMLYERRRAEPRDDLLTYLVQACDDEGSLSEGELITLFSSIFGAGSSTASIIASGMMELAASPEQAELLRSEPERWKRGTSEEALRCHPAIDRIPKKAAERTRAFDIDFEPGQRITVLLKATNRDPAQFDEPDRFDIRREISGAPHLTFGIGPHVCLGHTFARATIEEALAAFVARCHELELLEQPGWVPFAMENRFETLRIGFRSPQTSAL